MEAALDYLTRKLRRLNEARRLMLIEPLDATTAAFQVGYESASQFSCESSRLFGWRPTAKRHHHLRIDGYWRESLKDLLTPSSPIGGFNNLVFSDFSVQGDAVYPEQAGGFCFIPGGLVEGFSDDPGGILIGCRAGG